MPVFSTLRANVVPRQDVGLLLGFANKAARDNHEFSNMLSELKKRVRSMCEKEFSTVEASHLPLATQKQMIDAEYKRICASIGDRLNFMRDGSLCQNMMMLLNQISEGCRTRCEYIRLKKIVQRLHLVSKKRDNELLSLRQQLSMARRALLQPSMTQTDSERRLFPTTRYRLVKNKFVQIS